MLKTFVIVSLLYGSAVACLPSRTQQGTGSGQAAGSQAPASKPLELYVDAGPEHPLRKLLPALEDERVLILADAPATLQEKGAQASLRLGGGASALRSIDGVRDVSGVAPRDVSVPTPRNLDPPVSRNLEAPGSRIDQLSARDVGDLQRADLDNLNAYEVQSSPGRLVRREDVVNQNMVTYRAMSFENKEVIDNILSSGMEAPVLFHLRKNQDLANAKPLTTTILHSEYPYAESIFISTARRKEAVQMMYSDRSADDVIFAIDVPPGQAIKIDSTSALSDNSQVVIVGNLKASNIIGYWTFKEGKIDTFHVNPNVSSGAASRFKAANPTVEVPGGWGLRVDTQAPPRSPSPVSPNSPDSPSSPTTPESPDSPDFPASPSP